MNSLRHLFPGGRPFLAGDRIETEDICVSICRSAGLRSDSLFFLNGEGIELQPLLFSEAGNFSEVSNYRSGLALLSFPAQGMRRIRAAGNARHNMVLISSGTDWRNSEKEAAEGREKQHISHTVKESRG